MFAYYFSFILDYSFISFAHTLYACALSFYFTHSLGRFLTTLDLHVQILDILCYWSGVRWDRTCCEELEFSSTYSGIIVFLFIPVDSAVSLILYTLLSVVIPFCIHLISCVDIYM